MIRLRHWLFPAFLCLAIAGVIPAQTAPSSPQAVLDAAGGSVLRLSGTIKLKHADETDPREHNVNCLATVVDPSGIAIVASQLIDAGQDDRAQVLSSSLKLRRPDGTETAMRVAFSDNDLGLKVLVPESAADPKAPPAKCIPLDPTVKAEILSPVLIASRFGKVFDYQPFACNSKIIAVDPKPRLTYFIKRTDGEIAGAGAPVFTRTGQLLGLLASPESIVPVADICDLVAQTRKLTASTKGPQ